MGLWNAQSSQINGTVYFEGLLMIDLTAIFGSGNEPSVDWCNSNIKYFDGTTSIVYK